MNRELIKGGYEHSTQHGHGRTTSSHDPSPSFNRSRHCTLPLNKYGPTVGLKDPFEQQWKEMQLRNARTCSTFSKHLNTSSSTDTAGFDRTIRQMLPRPRLPDVTSHSSNPRERRNSFPHVSNVWSRQGL